MGYSAFLGAGADGQFYGGLAFGVFGDSRFSIEYHQRSSMNIFLLAWRNLWRHPIRSGLILLSVAVGLAAGLFVLGLYNGMMRARLQTVIEAEVGHIQLHAPGFKPDLDAKQILYPITGLLDSLQNEPAVRSIALRTLGAGMLSCAAGATGVVIQGIDPTAESLVSRLSDKIILGQIDSNSTARTILVGKKLADKYRLKIGTKAVLMVVDSSDELISAPFRVAGIFQSSNQPFDERNVYVSRPILNELLGIVGQAHECVVLLRTQDSTKALTRRYQTQYPYWKVEDWKELSPETDLLVSAVDVYSMIILVLIFLALSFGIINTLLMSVLERRHEFGMILALGMARGRIFRLVMWETFLLVLAGLPAGLVVAWGLIDHYHRSGIDFSKRSPDLMRSFGFESVLYPIFPTDQLGSVALIVFTTALLSGLFPAWRVLRLDPSRAMRT